MEYSEQDLKTLKFQSTAGFKNFELCFSKESVSHPAKANLKLLEYLIKTYTEEGSTVLDPMAGTFSTCVVAALLNRDGVGVELEEHFYRMGLANKELTDRHGTLTPKGKITVLRGDARCLTEILGSVDQIITSPPYEKSITPFEDEGKTKKRLERLDKAGKTRKTSGLWRSIEKANGEDNPWWKQQRQGYSNMELVELREDETNEGWYLKFKPKKTKEKIDVIVTSPPYSETDPSSSHMVSKKRADPDNPNYRPSWKRKIEKEGYLETKRPYAEKVDLIITSPPYAHDSVVHKGRSGETDVAKKKFGYATPYTGEVDVVLTSPPYEHPSVFRGKKKSKIVEEKFGIVQQYSDETVGFEERRDQKTGRFNPHPFENIGNLKGDNYLSQMKIVYANCYGVLKPEGKLILIVKNFIRNKKIVDLAVQTVKLCESIGFKLSEHLLFKLPTKSFWRVLYAKKYPQVDTKDLEHEHILIFRKVI